MPCCVRQSGTAAVGARAVPAPRGALAGFAARRARTQMCARPGCAQVMAASRLEATPCGGSVQLGAGLVDTGRCHDRCATTGLACADGKLRTAGHELGAPRNGVIGAAPTTRRRSQGCVSLSGRDVFETVLAGLRVAWVGMLYLSISRSLDTAVARTRNVWRVAHLRPIVVSAPHLHSFLTAVHSITSTTHVVTPWVTRGGVVTRYSPRVTREKE